VLCEVVTVVLLKVQVTLCCTVSNTQNVERTAVLSSSESRRKEKIPIVFCLTPKMKAL